jgi:hypothetical protein
VDVAALICRHFLSEKGLQQTSNNAITRVSSLACIQADMETQKTIIKNLQRPGNRRASEPRAAPAAAEVVNHPPVQLVPRSGRGAGPGPCRWHCGSARRPVLPCGQHPGLAKDSDHDHRCHWHHDQVQIHWRPLQPWLTIAGPAGPGGPGGVGHPGPFRP